MNDAERTNRAEQILDEAGPVRIKFWVCPRDREHRVEWTGEHARCLDCGLWKTPHDPVEYPNVPDETKCNLCPEEAWPCAERKRQRAIKKQAIAYLKGDLYYRDDRSKDDPGGIRFTSPGGWSVWMNYGVAGLPMSIRRPDGTPYKATTNGDIHWLADELP